MESVGKKIRKLRTKNKDSLKSLGAKIGYDWSNLSKVERGEYKASLDLIRKITKVYQVEPTYFIGDGFTDAEGQLFMEKDLETSALKQKYDFTVDGVEATEEEIKEAIRLLRHIRGD